MEKFNRHNDLSEVSWPIGQLIGPRAKGFTHIFILLDYVLRKECWPNGQCGGLRSGRPGSSTGRGRCVVFLGNTLS